MPDEVQNNVEQVDDQKNVQQSLNDTIKQVAADQGRADTQDKEDKTKEGKKEDKPEPKKHGLTEVEETQALELFAALKDKDKQPVVIDFLARNAGYKKIDTPAKAEEVKENTIDALKKALGPELDYLADKLGPVIDRRVDDILKENTKDLRSKLESNELDKLNDKAAAAMSSLAQKVFKSNELPDNVLVEMDKLMDKMPPSADMTVGEYIENIYYSVAGRLDIKPVNKQQEDRRERNRNDAPARIAPGGTRPIPGTEGAKLMSLDAAVKAAVAQLDDEEKK